MVILTLQTLKSWYPVLHPTIYSHRIAISQNLSSNVQETARKVQGSDEENWFVRVLLLSDPPISMQWMFILEYSLENEGINLNLLTEIAVRWKNSYSE
jgi:hypothetical protein